MPNETIDETQEDQTDTELDQTEGEDFEDEQVSDTDQVQEVNASEQQADGEEVPADLVIQLDDKEEDEEKAPGWVKDLRKRYREEQKARRQIEEELAKLKGGEPVEKPLTKPKLEDFDYDAEQYEAAVDKYIAAKAEHDRKQAQQRAQQEEAAKEWEAIQQRYAEGKAKLPKDKMDEAEAEVVAALSPARQGMLMDVADDSSLMVLALGTNPETLRKVASIRSDAKFIKELARIEMNIKAAPKKTPPPPERTISGSGRTPGATANNLDKLKAEAVKSGDYSRYFAEKRRLGK